MERRTFTVTSLGSQALILGYTWLAEHNPEIDWQTHKVRMSRCPAKCQTCRKEETTEHRERTAKARANAEWIRKICMGPFPGLNPEGESEEELDLSDSEKLDPDATGSEDDLVFEEGDRLFYVKMLTEAEFIRATQTMSYHLAEAAQKHARAQVKIPEYLWEFEEVFAKDSFDMLLERKVWDHAIELLPVDPQEL